VAGTWIVGSACTRAVGSRCANQHAGLHQGPHALLQEEGVALGAHDLQGLERCQATVLPQECLEHLVRAGRRQRVESQLGVVGFLAPAVLVLRAVVDQQEHTGGGQALHQAIEEHLGLGVDPVEVLEDEQEGLYLALSQQHMLKGLQGALTALRGIEGLPGCILHRHFQEGQEGWQRWPESRFQREQAPGELLAHSPPVVAVFDLKIGPQHVDDRQIWGGLAVRGRAALQAEPAVRARGMGELVEEAGFADSGFPDDRHHLAMAGPRLRQCLVQGLKLRLPPHEGGQAACRERLQTRPSRTGAEQLTDLYGFEHPLDRHRP
jgi:hypothetical protein